MTQSFQWWQLASFSLGVLLLGGAWLIEPDEERGLRNRLVDWWVAVTATRERAAGKLVVLSKAIAANTNKFLDLTFGPSLISIQFILGSMFVTTFLCCLIAPLGGMAELAGGEHLYGSVDYATTVVFLIFLYPLWLLTITRRADILIPFYILSNWIYVSLRSRSDLPDIAHGAYENVYSSP